MFRFAIGVLGLLCATSVPNGYVRAEVASRPEVFVYGTDTGLAWWLRKSVLRPEGKTVDGIALEKFNKLQDIGSSTAICFMSSVSNQIFVGIFRGTQVEIDQTFSLFPNGNFSAIYRTPSGKTLNARVVLSERCDSGEHRFGIVLYNDSREIEFFDEWKVEEDFDRIRIITSLDNGEISTSGCFMCGDKSILHFDEARKKFYWENVGD